MLQTKCIDYLVLHVNKNCRLSNYRHGNLKILDNLKKKFLQKAVQIIKAFNVPKKILTFQFSHLIYEGAPYDSKSDENVIFTP